MARHAAYGQLEDQKSERNDGAPFVRHSRLHDRRYLPEIRQFCNVCHGYGDKFGIFTYQGSHAILRTAEENPF